jgi:hypothetical protein
MIKQSVSIGAKLGTWFVLAISIISLPFTVFLAVRHPEGTHVPPSLIILPLGMLGVGLDKVFGGQTWKRILRWVAIISFTFGAIGTVAIWYIESYSGGPGFQIGENPGEYASQNIIFFLLLPFLFLYSSPSEKIRKFCSPLVWAGFVIAMMFLCAFIGIGLSKMRG